MEYDSDVLEYYDQPPKIKLQYCCLNGRQIGVLHTPDFFVIRRNSAGWEECKTQEALKNLALKMPQRYQLDSDGNWRCPPGEEFAQNLGLYYILRTDREINWVKQRNIYFLSDYLSTNLSVPTQEIIEIIKIISRTPGIKLSDLLEIGINPDYIYNLIANQTLYVDLESFSVISESEKVGVFINKEIASAHQTKNNHYLNPRKFLDLTKVGASGIWDGQIWHVVNVGTTTISLLSESSQIIELPNHEFHQLIEHDKFKALCASTENSSKIYELLKHASVDDCIEAYWLGTSCSTIEEQSSHNLDLEWHNFVAQQVGLLISQTPYLIELPSREAVAKSINKCIEVATQGKNNAFASFMYLSQTVPRDWRKGIALPQLNLLLRVCYRLSISLLDIYLGNLKIDSSTVLKELPLCERYSKTNRPFDADRVREFLEQHQESLPPQSLKQLAFKIGYDPADLYRHFPDLCRQISARYKLHNKSCLKPRV
jgi:TnsA endonuclease N terminal